MQRWSQYKHSLPYIITTPADRMHYDAQLGLEPIERRVSHRKMIGNTDSSIGSIGWSTVLVILTEVLDG